MNKSLCPPNRYSGYCMWKVCILDRLISVHLKLPTQKFCKVVTWEQHQRNWVWGLNYLCSGRSLFTNTSLFCLEGVYDFANLKWIHLSYYLGLSDNFCILTLAFSQNMAKTSVRNMRLLGLKTCRKNAEKYQS